MKIRHSFAVTVALAGVLAQPAAGATVVPQRPCLREGQPARFLGTGYGPGQPVAVSLDGRQFVTGAADAVGNVPVIIFRLPAIAKSEQARALSITQTNNPALTATAAFRETQVYVKTRPARFRPGRKLRIRAGGFYETGPTLYGHVRGPNKRNIRIGRIKGACGKVSVTKKAILRKGDGPGLYTVQFDAIPKYTGAKAPLRFRRAYTIRRIFRFSRSSSFDSPVMPGPPEGRIGSG